MRSLASIAVLGTLALLTPAAQSQMRGGGGGGGMRGGGGGGGVHMSAPAARVSSGRPMSSGPVGGFRGAPAARPSFAHGSPFRGQSVPVGTFNRQSFNTTHVSTNGHVVFFNNHNHFHSSVFFHNPFIFHNGFFGANCFGTFAFGNPFCGGFVGSAFFVGDPFFGLGYGYPYGAPGYGYYPGYSSPPPDYYPQQSSTNSDNNNNEVALTAEIQRLSDEIDYLRDDRINNGNRDQQNQDQSSASSGATLSAVPPSPLTIFVLRDGRRFTAQNYAISGQTLWILNEHSARRTPLSDIDRAATEKANAANGVEIRLPEPGSPN